MQPPFWQDIKLSIFQVELSRAAFKMGKKMETPDSIIFGKWQLAESENFDQFMSRLGVSYLVRTLGNRSSPVVTVITVVITVNAATLRMPRPTRLTRSWGTGPGSSSAYGLPVSLDGPLSKCLGGYEAALGERKEILY